MVYFIFINKNINKRNTIYNNNINIINYYLISIII